MSSYSFFYFAQSWEIVLCLLMGTPHWSARFATYPLACCMLSKIQRVVLAFTLCRLSNSKCWPSLQISLCYNLSPFGRSSLHLNITSGVPGTPTSNPPRNGSSIWHKIASFALFIKYQFQWALVDGSWMEIYFLILASLMFHWMLGLAYLS